jgi:DNA-binding NarL/FixJ family response regulator
MHAMAITERQQQVLQLIAHGESDKAIASVLGVSERVVRFHVSAASARLGAQSRAHAVALALSGGALRPDGPRDLLRPGP